MTPRTLYIETMGCQMNVLDSELVVGELLRRGYRPTDDMRAADLVVLNTCSVRQHAEDKVWSRLGELKHARRRRPEQIVAVIGCMAERDGDSLLTRVPHVDVLCGPTDLNLLPSLVDDVQQTRRRAVALSGKLRERSTPVRAAPAHDDLEALDSGRQFGTTIGGESAGVPPHQAYVRITRGCNKFCSFCVVPMTRGMEQHRPPDQIVAEARRLAAAGVREVTLLGQTVNHYVWDDEGGRRTSFADLLRRVHDEVPELPRLRFVTSFPRDFTDEALRVMAESPRICRYLHIPAQSGSNRLLKCMNRGYTIEQYRDLLDRARALMPDISLSGDMIVGFPGETEEDFAASVELLCYARYKNCFIFKYSPRPGTTAFDRFTDDVPDEVKRRRNNDLLAVQAEINLANHRAMMGRTVEVLVSGPSKAALRLQAISPLQESEQSRGEEVDAGRVPDAPHGAACVTDAPASPPVRRGGKGGVSEGEGAVDRGMGASGSHPSGQMHTALPRPSATQLVGRTSGDQIVVFDGQRDWTGRIMQVEIYAVTPYTLHGRTGDGSVGHAVASKNHAPSLQAPVVDHRIVALPVLSANS